jgi:hypothetical protein
MAEVESMSEFFHPKITARSKSFSKARVAETEWGHGVV